MNLLWLAQVAFSSASWEMNEEIVLCKISVKSFCPRIICVGKLNDRKGNQQEKSYACGYTMEVEMTAMKMFQMLQDLSLLHSLLSKVFW